MNYKKPGLLKLLRLVLQGRVARLVLVTRDRLLRFGAELLFQMCRARGVEVVVLDAPPVRLAQPQEPQSSGRSGNRVGFSLKTSS